MGYRCLLFLAIFFFGWFAPAQKKFVSSYLSFDTQRDWECQKFGFSWLCRHRQKPKTGPALIVILLRMIPGGDRLHTESYNTDKTAWRLSGPSDLSGRSFDSKANIIHKPT